jgi:vacuolar-type H+-ATPase subunit H
MSRTVDWDYESQLTPLEEARLDDLRRKESAVEDELDRIRELRDDIIKSATARARKAGAKRPVFRL